MATLQEVIPQLGSSPAIIRPAAAGAGAVSFSFGSLAGSVNTVRSFLTSLGLRPGSAIAIGLANSVEFAIVFFAVTYSGFVAAPLNPGLKQAEFEFYLQDLKCPVAFVATTENEAVVKAADKIGKFVDGGHVKMFTIVAAGENVMLSSVDGKPIAIGGGGKMLPEARGDDVALVLHTSGTTGRPKIVPLTHANLTSSIRNIRQTYGFAQSDTSLLVMPLFHVHGLLCGFLAPLSVNAAVVVPAKFSASSFWSDFMAHKATWFTAVPTIHQILLKTTATDQVMAKNIRFIRSCSSALAPSTMRTLEDRFGAPVVEAYAMTEASHQMTSNELPPGVRKPGSVGKAQGSVSVKILDSNGDEVGVGQEGEICVKGENVTKGYRNNKAANETSYTRTGYFRTGDQGKMDADGFVFITGRIKELINRGGEKISPVELDGVLLEHSAVAEAVTFGVPDEMYGQEVQAAVVVKAGMEDKVTEKELREFMASRVAKFKVAKKIYFTKEMPKTATGKIQRSKIADKFFGLPQARSKV
ncbi:hypothetical protein V1509DRAFT_623827 [Lipomyces kononenkoae]